MDRVSKDASEEPGFSLVCEWMLNIIINDDPRTIAPGTSVEGLLQQLGLAPRFLAVELNRRVIPRAEHSRTVLADGDRVEIVTLVGGG